MSELFVTPAQYAREQGVTSMAISKAIRDGRISQAIQTKGKRKILHRRIANYEFNGEGHAPTPVELSEVSGTPIERLKDVNKKKKEESIKAAKENPPPEARKESNQEKDDQLNGGPTIQTENPTPPGMPSKATSAAVRELYLAKMVKLEYEEKAGTSIKVEAVKLAGYNQGRVMRDMVLGMPDRLAPAIAAAINTDVDPEVVRLAMDEEIRNAILKRVD